MILYEVNLSISNEIADDYMTWLKPHIQAMLKFEGFIKAELYQNTEQEDGKTNVVASYYVDNEHNLQAYISEMSADMRADGIKRFGDKCVATRRILKLTDTYTSGDDSAHI